MTQQELSKQDSLNRITEMISQAKHNYQKRGSFQFLLWGWVIMLANLGHYYLIGFTDYQHPYLVWLITIPAGMASAVYNIKQSKNARVINHLDRMYGQVWIAAGAGIITVLIFMNQVALNHNALILLFAAIGTYITGRMVRFQPLILGGLALFIASVVCFNVPVTQQYLVGAIGIFVGYLIPGYLLKSTEK